MVKIWDPNKQGRYERNSLISVFVIFKFTTIFRQCPLLIYFATEDGHMDMTDYIDQTVSLIDYKQVYKHQNAS